MVRKRSASPPHSEGGGGSVLKHPRREFSARTRKQAWERANGYCEGQIYDIVSDVITRCYAPIDLGGFHYDHIIPDWMDCADPNGLANCQVLCLECHKQKTIQDLRAIAKSKRIIKKNLGLKKKRGKFKGWRKFDGTVVYAKR